MEQNADENVFANASKRLRQDCKAHMDKLSSLRFDQKLAGVAFFGTSFIALISEPAVPSEVWILAAALWGLSWTCARLNEYWTEGKLLELVEKGQEILNKLGPEQSLEREALTEMLVEAKNEIVKREAKKVSSDHADDEELEERSRTSAVRIR